jgi:electron transport complex protein RnfG
MAKLKSSFRNMFLSLGIICIVSGGVLAAMNRLTQAPIALSKKAKLDNALKAVLPAYDNSPVDEAYKVALSPGDSLTVYPATKDGRKVGAAVESNSNQGFSGLIQVIVGLDSAGTVINYQVLQHAETPGLGSKMEEWFRADKAAQNVLGRDLSQTALKVSKDGGEIDAITGATISSRAFLNALNRAYSGYSGKTVTDASSGATTSDADSGATTHTEGGME